MTSQRTLTTELFHLPGKSVGVVIQRLSNFRRFAVDLPRRRWHIATVFKASIKLQIIVGGLVGSMLVGCSTLHMTAPPISQPTAKAGWKLVWHDEFDGPTIDRTKWNFDIGDRLYVPERQTWVVGWGEESLQYHTDRPDNVFVKDGCLTLRARRENYKGCAYTSARMHTKGRFAKLYGRFEIRARLPVGQGLWLPLSLLPAHNAYGLWAASGEIDIMEAVGQKTSGVFGTIHFGSMWPYNKFEKTDYTFPSGNINAFHIYALEWEPGVLRWYVDDNLYATKTVWWSCSKTDSKGVGLPSAGTADCNLYPAPFDKPFYLHMAVNVGGTLPGAPDASTPFPADMVVDYVRVFDKVNGYTQKPAS